MLWSHLSSYITKLKMPSSKLASNDVKNLVRSLLTRGVDGLGPLSSSEELANEYLFDEGYETYQAKIDALIRWETAKNFGTGFITGVGGLVTLPVSVPASLFAGYFLQARLVGAVAVIHNHKLDEERVRTMVLLCMLGNAGKEVLKEAGIKAGNSLALSALSRISGKALIEINKKVGFRLFTKAGEKGVVNLTKAVPVVSGIVGGTVDAVACRTVGRFANSVFRHKTRRRKKLRV